jgi:hypothetical protein
LADIQEEKCQMEQRAGARCLALKSLKAKEIEMEVAREYGDQALRVSALKK